MILITAVVKTLPAIMLSVSAKACFISAYAFSGAEAEKVVSISIAAFALATTSTAICTYHALRLWLEATEAGME